MQSGYDTSNNNVYAQNSIPEKIPYSNSELKISTSFPDASDSKIFSRG